MLAVLVNTLAVLLGSTVGLLARKGIPEKVSGAIMTAISLCTLYAGVSGMLKGENTLVLIVSMVLGTAAGTPIGFASLTLTHCDCLSSLENSMVEPSR